MSPGSCPGLLAGSGLGVPVGVPVGDASELVLAQADPASNWVPFTPLAGQIDGMGKTYLGLELLAILRQARGSPEDEKRLADRLIQELDCGPWRAGASHVAAAAADTRPFNLIMRILLVAFPAQEALLLKLVDESHWQAPLVLNMLHDVTAIVFNEGKDSLDKALAFAIVQAARRQTEPQAAGDSRSARLRHSHREWLDAEFQEEFEALPPSWHTAAGAAAGLMGEAGGKPLVLVLDGMADLPNLVNGSECGEAIKARIKNPDPHRLGLAAEAAWQRAYRASERRKLRIKTSSQSSKLGTDSEAFASSKSLSASASTVDSELESESDNSELELEPPARWARLVWGEFAHILRQLHEVPGCFVYCTGSRTTRSTVARLEQSKQIRVRDVVMRPLTTKDVLLSIKNTTLKGGPPLAEALGVREDLLPSVAATAVHLTAGVPDLVRSLLLQRVQGVSYRSGRECSVSAASPSPSRSAASATVGSDPLMLPTATAADVGIAMAVQMRLLPHALLSCTNNLSINWHRGADACGWAEALDARGEWKASTHDIRPVQRVLQLLARMQLMGVHFDVNDSVCLAPQLLVQQDRHHDDHDEAAWPGGRYGDTAAGASASSGSLPSRAVGSGAADATSRGKRNRGRIELTSRPQPQAVRIIDVAMALGVPYKPAPGGRLAICADGQLLRIMREDTASGWQSKGELSIQSGHTALRVLEAISLTSGSLHGVTQAQAHFGDSGRPVVAGVLQTLCVEALDRATATALRQASTGSWDSSRSAALSSWLPVLQAAGSPLADASVPKINIVALPAIGTRSRSASTVSVSATTKLTAQAKEQLLRLRHTALSFAVGKRISGNSVLDSDIGMPTVFWHHHDDSDVDYHDDAVAASGHRFTGAGAGAGAGVEADATAGLAPEPSGAAGRAQPEAQLEAQMLHPADLPWVLARWLPVGSLALPALQPRADAPAASADAGDCVGGDMMLLRVPRGVVAFALHDAQPVSVATILQELAKAPTLPEMSAEEGADSDSDSEASSAASAASGTSASRESKSGARAKGKRKHRERLHYTLIVMGTHLDSEMQEALGSVAAVVVRPQAGTGGDASGGAGSHAASDAGSAAAAAAATASGGAGAAAVVELSAASESQSFDSEGSPGHSEPSAASLTSSASAANLKVAKWTLGPSAAHRIACAVPPGVELIICNPHAADGGPLGGLLGHRLFRAVQSSMAAGSTSESAASVAAPGGPLPGIRIGQSSSGLGLGLSQPQPHGASASASTRTHHDLEGGSSAASGGVASAIPDRAGGFASDCEPVRGHAISSPDRSSGSITVADLERWSLAEMQEMKEAAEAVAARKKAEAAAEAKAAAQAKRARTAGLRGAASASASLCGSDSEPTGDSSSSSAMAARLAAAMDEWGKSYTSDPIFMQNLRDQISRSSARSKPGGSVP